MTDINQWISDAEARCKVATDGPWRLGSAGPNKCPTVGTQSGLMVAIVAYGERHPTWENADFIAAARTDLPRALKALRVAMMTLQHYSEATYGYWEAKEATRLIAAILEGRE